MGERKALGFKEMLMGGSSEGGGGSLMAAWLCPQCGAVWVGSMSRPTNPSQPPFLWLLKHLP